MTSVNVHRPRELLTPCKFAYFMKNFQIKISYLNWKLKSTDLRYEQQMILLSYVNLQLQPLFPENCHNESTGYNSLDVRCFEFTTPACITIETWLFFISTVLASCTHGLRGWTSLVLCGGIIHCNAAYEQGSKYPVVWLHKPCTIVSSYTKIQVMSPS